MGAPGRPPQAPRKASGQQSGGGTQPGPESYDEAMPHRDPNYDRLRRLQERRNIPDRDVTLGFLRNQFKKQIEKPHKQLGAVVKLWAQLVPENLQAHARLEGLARGVLRVAVDDSAHLFEFDRLLREGLERRLLSGSAATLRRIQLRLDDQTPPARAAADESAG
jgi:hypothetical protein